MRCSNSKLVPSMNRAGRSPLDFLSKGHLGIRRDATSFGESKSSDVMVK